jgi:cobalamin synthase
MEGAALYKAFFYISLKFLTKIPLNKKISIHSKALGNRSSIFPQSGTHVETDVHFQILP